MSVYAIAPRLDLDQEQLDLLWHIAVVRFGYARDNPRLGWTFQEKRKAARYAVEELVKEALLKEKARR